MVDTKTWDAVSPLFDTRGKTNAAAADNMLIAWPPILHFVNEHVPKGGRILEYGCGTGAFAKKLASLGYSVMGVDPSTQMIAIAQDSGADVLFSVGTADDIFEEKMFDAITAVMVFQFESDIAGTFAKLKEHLNPGGGIVFAVFNPSWVVRCTAKGQLFSGFKGPSCMGAGKMDFGDGHVTDVYIRTKDEYDAVMKGLGFARVLELYPEFTKEFIHKFPTGLPADVSEYMVLGYTLAE